MADLVLHGRRGRPNPAGALDALYLLGGDCRPGPIARLAGELPEKALVPGTVRRLRLFHFNDLHHHLTLTGKPGGDVPVLAQIVHRYRRARAAAGDDEIVLLLSGGDDHTGTALDELLGWQADELVVDPAYAAYSAAGVDAATMGNHELDRGAAVLRAGIRASARFPVLSGNLYGSRHLELGTDYHPAVIAVAKGLRIGLLGLITPVDTRAHSAGDPDLSVASPLAVLTNVLPALTSATDFVVIMSHCGYGADSNRDGKAGAARFLAEGDIAIARAAARLSDRPMLVLGGHTHTVLNAEGLVPENIVDGVPIVQAGGMGSHVGEVDATLRVGMTRDRAKIGARLHRLAANAGEIPHDAGFEAGTIAPLLAQVRTRLDEVIAQCEGGDEVLPEATLRKRYAGECALANFITDAMVARSAELPGGPADIAIVNSTAIGTGLAPHAPITFRHWYGVIPFADCLQFARMSGADLLAVIANNAARIVRPDELAPGQGVDVRGYVSRGFLHFSAGVRYAIRLGHGAADASVESVAVLGRPLPAQLDRSFRVLFTNYLGGGGYGECWNGTPIGGGVAGRIPSIDLRPFALADTGLVFRNEMLAHLRSAGRVGPATGARLDGRLTVLA
ncbi:MAG: bifunctional metallophosphatase/5'-nucleotidase [Alphaproteobacteria bacterium]|nr:bifunctional metallophosphatase/5'-nucleotidase [Alphaproteobacteria bacterium]